MKFICFNYCKKKNLSLEGGLWKTLVCFVLASFPCKFLFFCSCFTLGVRCDRLAASCDISAPSLIMVLVIHSVSLLSSRVQIN